MAGDLRYAPDGCTPPGETLLEMMEERGYVREELANACELTVDHLDDLLSGKAPLTPELAHRLERSGFARAEFWLRFEARFRAYSLRGQEVRALTLHQPWATLVACGHKMVETRSWSTRYRGPLAIHSSRTYPRYGRQMLVEISTYGPLFDRAPWPEVSPLGVVLALADLVDCVPTEFLIEPGGAVSVGELEAKLGNYGPGRWAWLLRDLHVFSQPIPVTGARRLWRWKIPPEVAFV